MNKMKILSYDGITRIFRICLWFAFTVFIFIIQQQFIIGILQEDYNATNLNQTDTSLFQMEIVDHNDAQQNEIV